MTDLESAYCHSCKKKASSPSTVEKHFGYRKYRGKIYVQSHCRDCRIREHRLRRKAGLINHRK